MRVERTVNDDRRVKVVDWGENTRYFVEIHCIKHRRDNLLRRVKRFLGDTYFYTHNDTSVPRTRAIQQANGIAEHYQRITGAGIEYEVKVLPENFTDIRRG